MRGVATKYINGYAALFNVRWICRGMDDTEFLLKAKKMIKSLGKFATLNWDKLETTGLFAGGGFVCA